MTTISLCGSTGSIGTQTIDVVRTEVLAGPDALASIAGVAEVCVNAVVGFAGLPVTLATLAAGRRLALANKESLVAGGPVVQRVFREGGGEIVPIDSEHCAVHQCLRPVGSPDAVRRVILTASGGPFRGRRPAELRQVSVDDALAHPTWNMGPKITVDSSTLMNKGLEVIEAHELFGVDYDPFGAIDWTKIGPLEFEAPDRESFPCLDLAYQAGRAGGTAPACVNGANEIAVQAFLDGLISWTSIAAVIAETLEGHSEKGAETVEDVLMADREARSAARAAVARWAQAA